MIRKRATTLMAVLALLAAIIGTNFIPIPKVNAASLIHDDFESGLNGWGPGDQKPLNLPQGAHSGISCKVSDRTGTGMARWPTKPTFYPWEKPTLWAYI